MSIKLRKFFVIGGLLIVLGVAGTASAQVYYGQPSGMSQSEYFSYLQRVMAGLPGSLQTQYGSSYYAPVLNYATRVTTEEARAIGQGGMTIFGTAEIGDYGQMVVWFEYGQTAAMGLYTSQGTLTRYTGNAFHADLLSLVPGSTYYYRALAQVPGGTIQYGLTRTFVAPSSYQTYQNVYGYNYDHSYYYNYQYPYTQYDDYYYTCCGTEPRVITDTARAISRNSADLRGEVDMRNYGTGLVFLVYGEDDDQIGDIENDYNSYSEVDEDGDDLQKILVDSSIHGRETYTKRVYGLDDDTDYYFTYCVEYVDSRNKLACGNQRAFNTDGGFSHGDDEPEADTFRATNVNNNSARLNGEVDMNDFDNGEAFFVYGQDRNQVANVESDFDSYYDIDEDGDDLQKVLVDSDHDGYSTFWARVFGLDDDTDHYYQMCVGYEDDDHDDVINCGGVVQFETN